MLCRTWDLAWQCLWVWASYPECLTQTHNTHTLVQACCTFIDTHKCIYYYTQRQYIYIYIIVLNYSIYSALHLLTGCQIYTVHARVIFMHMHTNGDICLLFINFQHLHMYKLADGHTHKKTNRPLLCVHMQTNPQSLCSHTPSFLVYMLYTTSFYIMHFCVLVLKVTNTRMHTQYDQYHSQTNKYTASVFIHTVNDDRNAALKTNVTHWKEFLWEELHTCFHSNVFLESLVLKNSSTLETSASNVILFTLHDDILKQMFD